MYNVTTITMVETFRLRLKTIINFFYNQLNMKTQVKQRLKEILDKFHFRICDIYKRPIIVKKILPTTQNVKTTNLQKKNKKLNLYFKLKISLICYKRW